MSLFLYRITVIKTNGDSNILVCGTDAGNVEFRAIWNLKIYNVLKLSSSRVGGVSSMFFTEGEFIYPSISLFFVAMLFYNILYYTNYIDIIYFAYR